MKVLILPHMAKSLPNECAVDILRVGLIKHDIFPPLTSHHDVCGVGLQNTVIKHCHPVGNVRKFPTILLLTIILVFIFHFDMISVTTLF